MIVAAALACACGQTSPDAAAAGAGAGAVQPSKQKIVAPDLDRPPNEIVYSRTNETFMLTR